MCSGGTGFWFWLVSCELLPKLFIRLGDGQCFLQKAFLRSVFLPSEEKHSQTDPSTSPYLLIEAQSGKDDIVRFEEVYGRV